MLLVFAVIAGIVALVKQQSASHQARRATIAARVALARELGAQAVNEPRLDRAMLLAREAVNLDRSPQTEGTLLATLQRSPAVIGTFALPVDLAPQLALSPDGRTLAVSHSLITRCAVINRNDNGVGASCGDIRFYDPRTHAVKGAPLTHFGGAGPPVYSSDGSLLAYATDAYPPAIAVRDAQTHALLATLMFDPFQPARLTEDIAARQHPDRAGRAHGLLRLPGVRLQPPLRQGSRSHVPRSLVVAERAAAVDYTDRPEGGTRGEADRRRGPRAGRRRAPRERV